MIEAMTTDLSHELKDNAHAHEQFESDSALNHKVKTNKEVDELTVVSTAMIILIAGYDTTAQTLSFVG